eukprot:562322-Pelagomonas_calceolata.AAC.1
MNILVLQLRVEWQQAMLVGAPLKRILILTARSWNRMLLDVLVTLQRGSLQDKPGLQQTWPGDRPQCFRSAAPVGGYSD